MPVAPKLCITACPGCEDVRHHEHWVPRDEVGNVTVKVCGCGKGPRYIVHIGESITNKEAHSRAILFHDNSGE